MLQIYYVSKATLKTANKQYTSVQNDYEMTFNNDTIVEPCDEDVDLPSVQFDFIKINELESKAPNSMIGKYFAFILHVYWNLRIQLELCVMYMYVLSCSWFVSCCRYIVLV